jgi:hypothetical protein
MSLNRAQIDRGGNWVGMQGPGDAVLGELQVVSITTVGNGLVSAQGMLAGIIQRTGPTGNYADVFDSADNLLAAAPFLVAGDSFDFMLRNTVAFTNTPTAGEGVTLGLNTAMVASNVRRYLVEVQASKRRQVFQANTTNANAVVTGLTQAQCDLLEPGMGISGTGITGGTTVIAVNSVAGTVTLSANATATGSPALTFFPRYTVRGLYTAAL